MSILRGYKTLPPTARQVMQYTGGSSLPNWETIELQRKDRLGIRGRPPVGQERKRIKDLSGLDSFLRTARDAHEYVGLVRFYDDPRRYAVAVERVYEKLMVVVPNMGILFSCCPQAI